MSFGHELPHGGGSALFTAGAKSIAQHFAQEFHDERQALKDLYAALDPDADTRGFASSRGGCAF